MKIAIFPIAFISRLLVLTITIVIATAAVSNAQQNPNGYLGKGKDQYSVFVFGDALAGGLWAGTARLSLGHPRLKLNGRYREGSGLAKPHIYNWAERLPATLETRQVDIALVFIGTNDGQDIRHQGAYLAFNSDQWREVYTASVAAMMTQLTANKTAVYWIEVPPVKRPDLDQRLKIIADIHRKQAAIAGIRFIEIRPAFTTSDGAYTLHGADIDGNISRLRSRNGIRFIKAGNNKLASIILEKIDRDIAIADGDRPLSDFPLPNGAKTADGDINSYNGPIFGSTASNNQALIVEPQNMPRAGRDQSTNVLVSVPTFGAQNAKPGGNSGNLNGNKALNTLKAQVRPGSPAHGLFFSGVWPDSQPGRLDDFSQSAQ